MKNITAIVPIKYLSSRVNNKNFRSCGRRPLWSWILDTLEAVPQIDRIVISVDHPIVMQLIKKTPKCVFLQRSPAVAAQDFIMPIIREVTREFPADWYLQTHCTNPLLKPRTLIHAIAELLLTNHDSCFAVQRLKKLFWDSQKPLNYSLQAIPRTQDLTPLFLETCSFYIFQQATIDAGSRIGADPLKYELGPVESLDIDTEEEFLIADALLNAR